jgi:hypothetical protein
VWLDDDVKAGVASEPFLFEGFAQRSMHLAHDSAESVTFTLEVDSRGDGSWKKLREVAVPAHGSAWTDFASTETAPWLRLTANRDAAKVTAFFQYRAKAPRGNAAVPISAGIAQPADRQVNGGLLHARGENFNTLRFIARNSAGELGCYDLDGELQLRKTNDGNGAAWTAKAVAIPAPALTDDGGSMLHVDGQGGRWRLPKGDATLDQPGPLGPARLCREVCTERNLLNVHGTFYELPAENAGGFIKLRPVATHNRRIHDFASYRGLLVISGLADGAQGDHIIRSDDGQCALWLGAIDDLWSFGKPHGTLSAWRATAVKASVPSDACLATGYDRKRLTLFHSSRESVMFRVQADFTGTGKWAEVIKLAVPPNKMLEHHFPDAFGAYWLRFIADNDTTATATLYYE